MRRARRPQRPPLSLNEPEAGFYKTRLVRDGPFVPVMIYRPAAENQETGETTNRFGIMVAVIDGVSRDVYDAWPYCARNPITGRQYQRMLARSRRAKASDRGEPEARPYTPIDYGRLDIPF